MEGEEECFSYSVMKSAQVGGNKAPDYAAAVTKHFKILKQEDIRQQLNNDISTVSSVLCVPRGVACTLLIRQKWSLIFAYDEWFDDEETTRQPAGISRKRKSMEQVCKICHEEIRPEKIVSAAACGHPFCSDCWKTHISKSINDGPGCLTLLCPEPSCKFTSGLELVDSLASVDDRDKYYAYLYLSYVKHSLDRKWCPAPGCDSAIEVYDEWGGSYDVTCDCSHKFCWNCKKESHGPVDCNKKKRRIPCGMISIDEKSRMNGEKHTKRYINYYKRWHSVDICCRRALFDLNLVRKVHAVMLTKAERESQAAQLQFLTEAREQIVKCRRVLKWTYEYGYYLENSRKMTFFECLQEAAEAALERLHHCVQKEMDKRHKFPDLDLKDFRSKLVSLTVVTRRYIENLARALESNLPEIESFGTKIGESSKKLKH